MVALELILMVVLSAVVAVGQHPFLALAVFVILGAGVILLWRAGKG